MNPFKMPQRGMNPFIKVLVNFALSLRPAALRDPLRKGRLIGRDHLGNQYFETQTCKHINILFADIYHFYHFIVNRTARFYVPKNMDDWDNELPSEWNGKIG